MTSRSERMSHNNNNNNNNGAGTRVDKPQQPHVHAMLTRVLHKAVARMGKASVWQLAGLLRALQPSPPCAAAVRAALRTRDVYMSDDDYALLATAFAVPSHQHHHSNSNSSDDVGVSRDACALDVRALLHALAQCALSPRRAFVVDLVLNKVDASRSGVVSSAALYAHYDALRHPCVVSQTRSATAVVARFFARLQLRLPDTHDTDATATSVAAAAAAAAMAATQDDDNDDDNDDDETTTCASALRTHVTVEELRLYFAGVSVVTRDDTAFELMCARAFCLDRPRLCFVDEAQRLQGSQAMRHAARVVGLSQHHPLYTTVNSGYGVGCARAAAQPRPAHGRVQYFAHAQPTRLGARRERMRHTTPSPPPPPRDGRVTVAFVMVRGPAQLPRCLRVRVPCDGTTVTIGRSPDCDVVLDPLLVFASHMQCSVFGVATTTTTSTSSCARADNDNDATTTPARDMHTTTPAVANNNNNTTAAAVQLYMTDICSSNGTFVNGVRIGTHDATPLHDGDACIFGGMRDVAVGSALPPDAFAAPELVVWRVRVCDDDKDDDDDCATSTYAYALDATPLVLPSAETLRLQEQVLLDTVQRSLRKLRQDTAAATTATTTTVHDDEDNDDDEHATVLSVLLHARDTADAAVVVAARPHSKDDAKDELRKSTSSSGSNKRSVSIVATPSDTTTTTAAVAVNARTSQRQQQQQQCASSPPQPPHGVCFCVVRVGKHTFCVTDDIRAQQQQPQPQSVQRPLTTTTARQRGHRATRKRARATAAAVTTPPPPPSSTSLPCCLTFTSTHWHWTMDDPNTTAHNDDNNSSSVTCAAVASSLFHCMLPIHSIETLLVCVPRCGVAVELREGCHVPLVAPAVTHGSVEHRWVVWRLCATQPAATTATDDSSSSNNNNDNNDDDDRGKENETKDAVADKTNTHDNERDASAARVWFVRWLAQLEAYYAPYKMPAPHHIDVDVYDKLLSPPTTHTHTRYVA